MSVLTEALDRANARKGSLWDGPTGRLDNAGLCLMLSGVDLDPADLAGYMDAATASFAIEWAAGEELDTVFSGILAEGLLMGIMVERVQSERVKRGYAIRSAPSISATATTLGRLCLDRARGWLR